MFSGTSRINYLSTLHFDPKFLEELQDAAVGVEVRQVPAGDWAEIPPEVWAEVDVLHTSRVLCPPEAAPRLRWIQLDTSGVDHLRGHPVWDSTIDITTIGGVSPVPLAEYVMWAILGTAHRMPEWLAVHRSRQWPTAEQAWQRLMPAPVRGATLGIVGYGRIGREIGRLANAFGMRVLGMRRSGAAPMAAADSYYGGAASGHQLAAEGVELLTPADLPELMRRSDYVVVVVPLTDETRDLIGAQALGQLKHGAVLINVARGGIVDEQALREGLRAGQLSAAVLDVFDNEPLAPEDGWWDEPTAFITPHASGLAPQYSVQVLDIVSENIRRFAEGRPLLNLISRERGY